MLSDCVAGTVLYLTLCPVWLLAMLPDSLLASWLASDWLSGELSSLLKDQKTGHYSYSEQKHFFSGFKIASVRLSSEWVKQNNTSPMTVQQHCWLGLITVKVNCASVPVVVLVHVAASKQLLTLALYLLAVWEEIGLSAGNFLAAVKMLKDKKVTTWLLWWTNWLPTWPTCLPVWETDWWEVWLIHVTESSLALFLCMWGKRITWTCSSKDMILYSMQLDVFQIILLYYIHRLFEICLCMSLFMQTLLQLSKSLTKKL